MSRIIITDITEGATTDASDVTATVSSWNTSTVGPENVRDEGLDERMFAPETAAIVSDFLEYNNSYEVENNLSDFDPDWGGVEDQNNNLIFIGPISYIHGESDLIVRFSAELTMPSVGGTCVGADPKMTLNYRLAFLLRPEGSPDPNNSAYWATTGVDGVFKHTMRRVGLSPYPRSASGSARYRNDIATTLLLNQDTIGAKPHPNPGEGLYVGLQVQKYAYERNASWTTEATSGSGGKFTLGNISLNCAHYKR